MGGRRFIISELYHQRLNRFFLLKSCLVWESCMVSSPKWGQRWALFFVPTAAAYSSPSQGQTCWGWRWQELPQTFLELMEWKWLTTAPPAQVCGVTGCIPETTAEQAIRDSACWRWTNGSGHGQGYIWVRSLVHTGHFSPMLPLPCVFSSFKTDQSAIWKIYMAYVVYLQDLFESSIQSLFEGQNTNSFSSVTAGEKKCSANLLLWALKGKQNWAECRTGLSEGPYQEIWCIFFH